MYNTSTMHLIYQNHKGQEFSQHWLDLTEMGTLVDPETGEDLELIGWHSDTTAAAQAIVLERDTLRAEVERLRQLVNGGRGPLPAGAVAWLDMSPGEALLAFDKKSDSNRANKRRVMELFHRVSAGYYPLYLEPQADRAERLAEALREAEKDLRQLSVINCGCKPCRRACRTGKGAEWELESRMKTAQAAANKARAALHPTAAQADGA